MEFAFAPIWPSLLWTEMVHSCAVHQNFWWRCARWCGSHSPHRDCVGRLRVRSLICSENTNVLKLISPLDICCISLCSLFLSPLVPFLRVIEYCILLPLFVYELYLFVLIFTGCFRVYISSFLQPTCKYIVLFWVWYANPTAGSWLPFPPLVLEVVFVRLL